MKGAYGKARLGTIAILGVAAFAIMAAAERARLRKGIPKFSNSRNVWGDCMKRILLSSIVAGGLALMTAPPASALPPGLCGHSYAMLMKGAEPQLVSATGGTGLPGAITSAFGVGTITFAASTDGTDCTATGELIYNCGDIQTNPISLYFGPASVTLQHRRSEPDSRASTARTTSQRACYQREAPTGHTFCHLTRTTAGLTHRTPKAPSHSGSGFRTRWAAGLRLEPASRVPLTPACREMALRS